MDLDEALAFAASNRSDPVEEGNSEDEDDAVVLVDGPAERARRMLSYALGCLLGRWDIRIALGHTPSRTRNDDEALPATPEGILSTLPNSSITPYPIELWTDGIAVQDNGHARDLVAAMLRVLGTLGVEPTNILAELQDSHGDLSIEMRDRFFRWHLRVYTLGRRKAPIYWQLATPSASYSVWLYLHAFTKDTLYKVQNDYVAPKLAQEERRLDSLRREVGESPKAAERRILVAQEKLVEELRAFLEEVKRVAPLCSPNLDDGVIINFALLWRFVPHHKPWQKELKSTWKSLCAGEYDWAHLAMHLWPERVVPMCVIDRSIAIAHKLENLFWLKDFTNQWRVVREPAQERQYVASHWASSPRSKLVTQARELWEQRYLQTGRNDSSWWNELETGEHDDHVLAIQFWPHRVCERALVDPVIARSHELNPPKLAALGGEEARPQIEAWLERMSRRHSVAKVDRSFISDAFCDPGASPEWKAWWLQLDEGRLDHLPVARYLHPEQVAKACQSTLELADAHEVRRFFFIDSGSGLRKRLTPTEELSREVAERTSPAVKDALKSLLEAPTAVSGARRKGGRRRALAVAEGRSR